MNVETMILENMTEEIIFFESELLKDSIQELVDRINSLPKGIPIKLYFCTNGGSPVYTEYLVEFLNTRYEDITIYCLHYIISSGVQILLNFKGKIVLTKHLDYVLIHLENRTLDIHKEGPDGDILRSYSLEEHKKYMEELKAFSLTKTQRKVISERKDLYIYRNDFKVFKKRKNIIIE